MLAIAVWHFPIVSASIWLGFFISMLFLNLSVIQKQWPHREARSPACEKVPIHTICAYSSIILSVAGSIGLILLSSFDYINYTSVHYSSLALFIAAHSICAILLVVQSALACITSNWQHGMLFTIFIIRASLAIIEATLGIVFGFSSRHPGLDGDLSAILEWGK
ncbi:hypothetical protein BDV41DRAFT_566909 [Aspergillus transmontanensis]|uniref:CWH43-like N-terminal domain-containing protein n=1 Tax=Aspergillus transmontanensis TaxID=1034304 RepID=A0A5N6VN35_9EURO|nr:hypothetical protein BDV41DRAFT_566909 [Aspergillus transmontanensis]